MPSTARLWITWEKQRRNQSMATWLSADLHELQYSGSRIQRYLVLCTRTIRLLCQRKPDIIFFQNPSIVLAALVVLLKKLHVIQCKVVGDFHNAGVYPKYGAFVCRWIARGSDLTIVSNENLVGVVNRWGATAIAIPDPLPTIHGEAGRTRTTPAEFIFLFVCSWADDEPVAHVVQAAAMLEERFPACKVFITGRPKIEKHLAGVTLPASVTLTGFLSERDFDDLLRRSDVIIDLTTRPDCMVCGAYEAIAAERPAILSDNPPTRQYFHRGVEFTDNSAASIFQCMTNCYQNIDVLNADIRQVKRDIETKQTENLQRLETRLA